MSGYALLADLVLVVHFAIVLFVVGGVPAVIAGNRLGWHWVNRPGWRIAHLGAIGYVAAQSWFGLVCPLTTLAAALRRRAGGVAHGGDFIAYWLQRLLFYDAPWWVFALAYTAFGLLVAATWVRHPPQFRRQNP